MSVDKIPPDTLGNFWDTDASNQLTINWNEDDSADRNLNIKLDGADRTLTIAENASIRALKDEDNMASDSALHGATQQSIKAYADVFGALGLGAANYKIFMNAAGVAPEWADGIEQITSSIDTATASGTQNISGFSFQPSHVIILAIVNSKPEVSISFHNGTLNTGIASMYALTAGDWAISGGIFLVQASGIYYAGTVTFHSDGITIAWTKTGAKVGTAALYILGWR